MKHKILLDLYNALVKNEYPEIENIDPEKMAKSVLYGKNYSQFLSWVLRRQNGTVFSRLETLKDAALLEELVKICTNLGMCIERNIFSEGQLSQKGLQTIETLIIYMKSQNDEGAANGSFFNINRELVEQQRDHLLKSCKVSDCMNQKVSFIQSDPEKLSNANSTITYPDVREHILSIEKETQRCSVLQSKMIEQLTEKLLNVEQVNLEEKVPLTESNSAAIFMQTFGNHQWPLESQSNDQLTRIFQKLGNDFKDIESKFTVLKKTVDDRNQVLSSPVSQNSSLLEASNEHLEDIVMSTTKVCNAYKQ